MEDLIVRPAELADRLGVSRQTLWRWSRSGRLPAPRQLGPRAVGFLASEIRQFLDGLPAASSTDSSE